ncbi:MAG: ABC transporter substrate-binding protein, partial [Gemmatimonadota bacterium]
EGRLQAGPGPLALATGWTFGADSTTITFHLRADARWSDGAPLTAADVAFSYELYADSTTGSPRRALVEEITAVEATDERTVVMMFRRRHPAMLVHASLGVVPRHIYGDADRAHLRSHPRVVDPAGGRLVVSGPFQVIAWENRQDLVLGPNPRSWVRPRLARVVLRVLPEESTRLVELERGGVDVARITSFDAAHRLAADPAIRIERQPMRFYDYVAWNPGTVPLFAQPEARRALSLAIDRQRIVDALNLTPYAIPAGGPYPPIFADLQDPGVAPDPYRPDEAAAILDRIGAVDRDGDGVREWRGRPLRFVLLTNSGNERRDGASQLIQAQLARVGIEVALRQMETSAFFQRLRAREFESALGGWSVALTPELNVFRSDAHALNFVAYESPAFDSLFALARSRPSAAAAAPLWREAAAHVARDRPYAFLWFYDMLFGVRARVRDVRMDPLAGYGNLYEWQVAEPQESGAGRAP